MKNLLKRRSGNLLFDIFNITFLVLLAFITLYPMWYIAIVSISSATHINLGDVKFIPKGINFTAYRIVFQNDKIWTAYRNTILYTVVGTLINVITLTMFVSGGMIPLYLVIMNLRMINTMWAIVLPPAISTYNMIVMRTSFEAIPISLTESAYLDGANDMQILGKVIMPLSKPILATMTLFYAVSHWNSFFPAMLYLNSQDKYPVQVIMRDIVIAGDMADEFGDIQGSVAIVATNYKYAVIIISMVPILCVYPFLQRHFTKGVLVGAVKG